MIARTIALSQTMHNPSSSSCSRLGDLWNWLQTARRPPFHTQFQVFWADLGQSDSDGVIIPVAAAVVIVLRKSSSCLTDSATKAAFWHRDIGCRTQEMRWLRWYCGRVPRSSTCRAGRTMFRLPLIFHDLHGWSCNCWRLLLASLSFVFLPTRRSKKWILWMFPRSVKLMQLVRWTDLVWLKIVW